jgi:hypothetical protein
VSVFSVLRAMAGAEIPEAAQAFLLITQAHVFTTILTAVHAQAFAAFPTGQPPWPPPMLLPGTFPPNAYGWGPLPGYGIPLHIAPGQVPMPAVPVPPPLPEAPTGAGALGEDPIGDFIAAELGTSRPRDPRERMTGRDSALSPGNGDETRTAKDRETSRASPGRRDRSPGRRTDRSDRKAVRGEAALARRVKREDGDAQRSSRRRSWGSGPLDKYKPRSEPRRRSRSRSEPRGRGPGRRVRFPGRQPGRSRSRSGEARGWGSLAPLAVHASIERRSLIQDLPESLSVRREAAELLERVCRRGRFCHRYGHSTQKCRLLHEQDVADGFEGVSEDASAYVFRVLRTHPWRELSPEVYIGMQPSPQKRDEVEWINSVVQARVRELRQEGHDPVQADDEDKRVLQAMRNRSPDRPEPKRRSRSRSVPRGRSPERRGKSPVRRPGHSPSCSREERGSRATPTAQASVERPFLMPDLPDLPVSESVRREAVDLLKRACRRGRCCPHYRGLRKPECGMVHEQDVADGLEGTSKDASAYVDKVLRTHPWRKLSLEDYNTMRPAPKIREELAWKMSMVQARIRELQQMGHGHDPLRPDEDKRVLQAMRDDGIFLHMCCSGRECRNRTSECAKFHQDDSAIRRMPALHREVVEYILGKEPPHDAGRAARDAWSRSFVALAKECLRKRRQDRGQATKTRLGKQASGNAWTGRDKSGKSAREQREERCCSGEEALRRKRP